MTDFLYRVQIVEYPEGALHSDPFGSDLMIEDPNWRPEGWAPDAEWVERFGRHSGYDFYWPSTRKEWRSRSSAMKRKQLIESYGAKAILQRSARIVWPEDSQEHVNTS